MMRCWNFAREFEERHFMEDIPARVRKTEYVHWVGMAIAVALIVMGVGFILSAPEGSTKLHAVGLLLAVEGFVVMAIMGAATTVTLAMYYIIWDRRQHMAVERLTVEAQDL